MISDMQVINFLTREFKWISRGEKRRGDEAGKQWIPSFFNGHGQYGQATALHRLEACATKLLSSRQPAANIWSRRVQLRGWVTRLAGV
jgi:hypothetical protein